MLSSIVVLTLLVVAFSLTPDSNSLSTSFAARVIGAVAIVAGAIVLALRSVVRAEFPILRATETISMIVGVLIVGFASVYLTASGADPDAFSEPLDHTGAIYFALTTATTVGYGDIAPRSNPARIAVMVQMVANVVVLGVATRLLIGTAQRRSRADDQSP